MKLFKGVVAAAALTLASFSAYSAPITVGGVTWDPDFSNSDFQDFTSTFQLVQWWSSTSTLSDNKIGMDNWDPANRLTPGNGELMGLAKFLDVNGSSSFVCSTCSLSLAFGGISFDNSTQTFDVSNSWWKVYANSVTLDNFSSGSYAAAQSANDLFLFGDFSFFTLQSGSITSGTSLGFMNVLGGLAAQNFDTNSINAPDLNIWGKDLQVSATVNTLPSGVQQGSGGTATGQTVAVPAPASIALLGLGLLGLAGGRRFKKA